MVEDDMNDSPALSAEDVGIAISDDAQLAREIADITIDADYLSGLVTLKSISDGGDPAWGWLVQSTTSALVRNVSTLAISLGSMKNLLE